MDAAQRASLARQAMIVLDEFAGDTQRGPALLAIGFAKPTAIIAKPFGANQLDGRFGRSRCGHKRLLGKSADQIKGKYA